MIINFNGIDCEIHECNYSPPYPRFEIVDCNGVLHRAETFEEGLEIIWKTEKEQIEFARDPLYFFQDLNQVYLFPRIQRMF